MTITHAKTDNIAAWTQADLDAQIALGNFPPGTVLNDIVLPSDWNAAHVIDNGTITNAMLANAAVSNLSGTNTGDQTISDATIYITDITTNNVTTSAHGFAPKAPNDATKYLDGTGAYSVPPGSGGSPAFSAITGATNTTAAMVVGAGASLNFTSTGTINASTLGGATFSAPGAIGNGTESSGAFTSITASSTYTGTTSSANAMTIGQNGATTPAFTVDASAGTQQTGIRVVGTAHFSTGPLITATSDQTTEPLRIQPKGDANLTLNTGGTNGVMTLQLNSVNRISLALNQQTYSSPSTSGGGGQAPRFLFKAASDTALQASQESPMLQFDWSNGGNARQHSTGAIALQRDTLINPSLHSFVAASTITDAATVGIAGQPNAGNNATITNSHGLFISGASLSNTTNGIGLTVLAPSGATNNFAEKISGYTLNAGTGDTIAAGTGAGGSPTIAIAGPPGAGTITLTTGTTPALSATIATISYGTTFPYWQRCSSNSCKLGNCFIKRCDYGVY